jgi:hypothetical protein
MYSIGFDPDTIYTYIGITNIQNTRRPGTVRSTAVRSSLRWKILDSSVHGSEGFHTAWWYHARYRPPLSGRSSAVRPVGRDDPRSGLGGWGARYGCTSRLCRGTANALQSHQWGARGRCTWGVRATPTAIAGERALEPGPQRRVPNRNEIEKKPPRIVAISRAFCIARGIYDKIKYLRHITWTYILVPASTDVDRV